MAGEEGRKKLCRPFAGQDAVYSSRSKRGKGGKTRLGEEDCLNGIGALMAGKRAGDRTKAAALVKSSQAAKV